MQIKYQFKSVRFESEIILENGGTSINLSIILYESAL